MKALLACMVLGAALVGAETPPTATTILDGAKAQAAPQQKAIFLIFHASW